MPARIVKKHITTKSTKSQAKTFRMNKQTKAMATETIEELIRLAVSRLPPNIRYSTIRENVEKYLLSKGINSETLKRHKISVRTILKYMNPETNRDRMHFYQVLLDLGYTPEQLGLSEQALGELRANFPSRKKPK